MIHIRPWQLFSLLPLVDRTVVYRIPAHSGVESGTVSSLDTLCLISVIRTFQPRTMLEFGTGLGYNALHLCLNTDLEHITTVDNDGRPRVFSPEFDHCVHQVKADVMDFSPTRQYDLTFCDVNIPGVTERCTEIARSVNPKIMAWHDYGHPLVPHVKTFLDELSQSIPLVHIEDSLMVFWFRDEVKFA